MNFLDQNMNIKEHLETSWDSCGQNSDFSGPISMEAAPVEGVVGT